MADALIDGYNATYEFHSAKDISVTGLIALFGLMLKDKEGFAMWHTAGGEMQVLPDVLAKKLNIKFRSPITDVAELLSHYDAVVLATTADVAKKIYTSPTQEQKKLLDSVHYSCTITVSFRVPLECVKDLAIITVPNIESEIISSYSNESNKGTIVNGQTLVNVWVWDSYAPELLKKTDGEIFEIVKKELIRVCPPLQRHPGADQGPDSGPPPRRDRQVRMTNDAHIVPHDLERLPISMPKYEHGYITRVAEFWNQGQAPHGAGQGANNVWFCGDYLNAPWVEGSVRCGQKIAKQIRGLY